MKKRIYIKVVMGMVSLFVAATSVYAAEKMVIKATSVQMPTQNIGEALMILKANIEAKLPGQVEVKAYPSAQLYTQTEEIAALSRGEIQMAAVIGTGSMPIISPVFQVIELPGLFPSKEVFLKVIHGPTGQELWAEAEKKNIKVVSVWDAGKTEISNRKGIEIKFPKDAVNLKIRAAGKTYAGLLEAWGAMSVNIASQEQYSALQQGVMDGIFTAVRIIHERKLYEHLTNLTDLGYLVTRGTAILANNKWWNSLQPEMRNAIAKAAQEAAATQNAVVDRDDAAAFKAIAGAGVKVYRIPPADFKIWQEPARKVWPKLSAKIGQAWVDKLKRAVDEAK
jgi:C4-dicarboxylate-binding protein DctP